MSAENTPPPSEAKKNTPSYRLDVNEASGQLMGIILTPSPTTVSMSTLNRAIESQGCQSFYFVNNGRELFVKKLKKGQLGSYLIGERRDAKIKITVSSDKMCARVQTSKAYDGLPLTIERIQQEIQKTKVDRHCLDKQKLANLITSTEDVDLIIAKGRPAINGVDAMLTPLVESAVGVHKDADSKEAIDQTEVFTFIVVEPNCPLMMKVPFTQGTDGSDVMGKRIKAKSGKDLHFSKPFVGVEISPENDNLLVASIKGHPIVGKSGVKVDPVMVLEAVDIRSGNVDFDGSLVISKDIESGYRVNASGDVWVKGAVFKSDVTAGGSIVVNGGIHSDDAASPVGCQLETQGDVRAKFIHHSRVCAQGGVHVAEYIMQSRVIAKGPIYVGQERGKGCIIGGYCQSEVGVSAKSLGSEAYVTTVLKLGDENALRSQLVQLKNKYKRRRSEEAQLDLILKTIRGHDKPTKVGDVTLDKERKVENTLTLLRGQLTALAECIQSLALQVESSEHLRVSVSGRIYPNVRISINNHSWNCETIRNRIEVKCGDDELIVDPLP